MKNNPGKHSPHAGTRDRRADPDALTLMALNAEFLWDGVGPEEGHPRIRFPWRGNRVEAERHMRRIAEIVETSDPDIVVLCEVENLHALERFNSGFLAGSLYRAYTFQGDDIDTGQDVGLLTRIEPDEVWFHEEAGRIGEVTKGLTKNIVARLRVGRLQIGLVGVHLISNPDDRSRRHAREAQALAIRELARRLRSSGCLPIVCGDFNDFDGAFGDADAFDNMPISRALDIARDMNPKRSDDDLVNAARFVPKVARYTSHRDRNHNGRVDTGDLLGAIDHVLLAPELAELVERVDIPKHDDTRGSTRHFPVVVRLRIPRA